MCLPKKKQKKNTKKWDIGQILYPECEYMKSGGKNARAEKKYIDVAIKVRHPSILEDMVIDISTLYALTHFVSKIPLPGFGLLKVPIYQQGFAEYLQKQIDLSIEAESLDRFNQNFKYDTHLVVFPKPIPHLVTKSVLVETWEGKL